MSPLKVVRNELKYYINYSEYYILKNKIRAVLRQDKNCRNNDSYFIRSLYFDNLRDDAFLDKLAGIETRKKYRIRIYNNETKCIKFEIKNKMNNQIEKHSAEIKKEDVKKIKEQDYSVLLNYNNKVLNEAYYVFKSQNFKPVVIVDYFREAYKHNFNNIRITFDKELHTGGHNMDLFNKNIFTSPIVPKGRLILEIKYNHFLPDYIKGLLTLKSFEKCAISKYVLCRMGFANRNDIE